MSKKLFAFDLDGTLVHDLEDSKRGIPAGLVESVLRLSRSHHVIVATGRRFRTALNDIHHFPHMPFVVVHNGSVICDIHGNTLIRHEMTFDEVKASASLFLERDIPFLVVVDGFKQSKDFVFLRSQAERFSIIHRIIENSQGFHFLVDDLEEIASFNTIPLEVASVGPLQEMLDWKLEISDRLPPTLKCLVVRRIGASRNAALEIMPKNVSKWTGVQWVAEKLGADYIVAAGDDENDFEMIENANVGIAMSHSQEHLRNIAEQVVSGSAGLKEFLDSYEAS